MADQENNIRDLESQFPALSGVAFSEASKQTLAAGRSVLQTDQGFIYEFFPDGRRVRVKAIDPPTPVTLGQKINIR
jgi:hypothetical protein